MYIKVGKRVREVRERRNMTQEFLAEKTDLSISAISRLENGKTMVSVDTLCHIADALEVGLQDLLCDLFTYISEEQDVVTMIETQLSTMSLVEKEHILAYIEFYKKNIKPS